jgi:hypothetical protein
MRSSAPQLRWSATRTPCSSTFYDDSSHPETGTHMITFRLTFLAPGLAAFALFAGACSSGSPPRSGSPASSVPRDSGAGNSRDASSEDNRVEASDAHAAASEDSRGDVDDDASLSADRPLDSGDLTNPDARDADVPSDDGSSPADAFSPADASGADAAASCAGLFCEDFEAGALDPSIWSVETGGGQTVSIEDRIVAHGKHSIHFHVPPNVGTYGFIITKGAPAALHSHYFGRASFYVTPMLPGGNEQLVVAGNGTIPDFDHFFVAAGAVGWMRRLVLTNTVVGEEETWGNGPIPSTRWACLEWEMNDVPGRTTLFIDGAATVPRDIRLSPRSYPFEGFAEFGFGYYAAPPNNGPLVSHPVDVYYDDIVLSTARIGCL